MKNKTYCGIKVIADFFVDLLITNIYVVYYFHIHMYEYIQLCHQRTPFIQTCALHMYVKSNQIGSTIGIVEIMYAQAQRQAEHH